MKNILQILLALFALTGSGYAYTPRNGVRDPAEQLGYEIDRAVPAPPASWGTTPTTATAGYFYISKTHPSATNTDNPYGHPDTPRKELAGVDTSNLTGVVMVYFDGGTYSRKDAEFNYLGTYAIGGSGTSESPIWIVGNPTNRPTLARPIEMGYTQGDDIIYSDINFGIDVDGGTTWRGYLDIRPRGSGSHTAHNIIVRHCTFTGAGDFLDGNAIAISSSLTDPVGVRDMDVTGVVIYDCTIHGFGVWDAEVENDVCGVYKDFRTEHVWVLGCTIYRVGGDGVAGSSDGDDDDYQTRWLWAADNIFYECGENGIDVKALQFGVFAGNEIYGPMGQQQGGGAICHSGTQSIAVQNIAFLHNNFHDLAAGASCAGSVTGNGVYTANVFFIGNRFHNMDSAIAEQADANLGFCMQSASSTGTVYAVHNSCEEYEIGIIVTGSNYDAVISSNIFGTRTAYVPREKPGGGFWSNFEQQWYVGDSEPVVANYNCYKGTPSFTYNGGTRNFAYLQSQGLDANSLNDTDPLFTNAGAGTLTLQSGSPCIGSGNAVSAAYAAYESVFGVALTADAAGNARPQGGTWDMGAFEYVAGGGLGTLNATTVTGPLIIGTP